MASDLQAWSRKGMQVTGVVQTAAGISAALTPALFSSLMYGHDISAEPLALRLHLLAWLLISAVGASYAHAGFIARVVPRSTLLTAILGKSVAVVLFVEMWLHGLATPLILGAAAFDATLVAVFALTFLQTRDS